MQSVLVTGGAGFIGSHVVDLLVDRGSDVTVLDSIEPQVHGTSKGNLNPSARHIEGSVTDPASLAKAMDGVTAVVHLAAQVGVGQSMYELNRYVHDNCVGTSTLLEAISQHGSAVETLIVASSMSIYGEGQYRCDGCGDLSGRVAIRPLSNLESGRWEPECRNCGNDLLPVPTPETKPLQPDSIYAITKRDQEEMCLVFGKAYGVRTVALRFFNAYGDRQSLSNPYTGVAAIFASRLLNGQSPLIFEDGGQSRDFVHVSDIVQAVELALTTDAADGIAMNVGTGAPTTVVEVARALAAHLDVDIQPKQVNRFRHGDVRHCYADISLIKDTLGYTPAIPFDEGMGRLVEWIVRERPQADDRVDLSTAQLEHRGLII